MGERSPSAGLRLVGIDYFSWNSDPWSKTVDADSLYRCGQLTESASQAIASSGKATAPDPTATLHIRVDVPLVARGPARLSFHSLMER